MPELAFDLRGFHNALKRSFVEWSTKHRTLAPLFARINAPTMKIALDAIEEITVHKPSYFEVWWAINHNRYIRTPGVTQKQMALLFEVFYSYLSVLARGGLQAALNEPYEEDEHEEDDTKKEQLPPALVLTSEEPNDDLIELDNAMGFSRMS